MRKFISFLFCVVMVCSLFGCVDNKNGGEMATGNGVSENENELVVEKKEIKYDFSNIEGLGNDPAARNAWKSLTAFDDNYIYFHYDGGIYKMDYSGLNLEYLGYTGGRVAWYLNVWNGYIYYAVEETNASMNYMIKFYRLDTSTGERQVLFEEDLGIASFEIMSMLVYKDLLISVCTSNGAGGWSGRDFTRATAYDLKTGERYTIMAKEAVRLEKATISVDENDNIYMYLVKQGENNKEDTWLGKISIDDIRNGMMVTDIDIHFNIDNKDIVYPGGIFSVGESDFMRRDYDSIDMEDGSWTIADDSLIHFDETAENIDVLKGEDFTSTYRYIMLGENMLIIKDGRVEPSTIYLVKDLDFSNIDLIYKRRFSVYIGWGIHDGKLYCVEMDPETEALYMFIIDGDGNVNECALIYK